MDRVSLANIFFHEFKDRTGAPVSGGAPTCCIHTILLFMKTRQVDVGLISFYLKNIYLEDQTQHENEKKLQTIQ